MYYLLIVMSIILFGGNFALNGVYQKKEGSSVKSSLVYTFISSIAGLVALMAINGFKFEITLFTFIMALLSTVAGSAFTYCSFKALGKINLSLYSLFSMLGGMMLPFLLGVLFFGEPMTYAKIVCLILISVALLLTVERGEKKKGTIYYVGIFVLNGLSGVFSKLFTSLPFQKTSAEGYSILIALCTVILSGSILLIFFRDKNLKLSPFSLAIGSFNGITNKIANLLGVIALAHVEASVQAPMVTGGVMVVSTIICFFTNKKPTTKDLLSVLFALIGTIALFAIPI